MYVFILFLTDHILLSFNLSLTMSHYLDRGKISSNIVQAHYLFCPFLCDHCTHKDLRRVNLKERESISQTKTEKVRVKKWYTFPHFLQARPSPQKYKYCDNFHKFFYISWLPWCDPNHKTSPVSSACISLNAKMAQMINTRSISRKDLDCE